MNYSVSDMKLKVGGPCQNVINRTSQSLNIGDSFANKCVSGIFSPLYQYKRMDVVKICILFPKKIMKDNGNIRTKEIF